jgi:hypothetical protein
MHIPDFSLRTVRLQVQLIEGDWKLRGGDELPQLAQNTNAELILPAHSLLDPEIRAHYMAEETREFFPKGTILYAQVSNVAIPNALLKHVVEKTKYPAEPLTCVGLTLTEQLDLRVRGTKLPLLSPCHCYIPSLQAEAESVNEACSRISTAFEPKRRSHGGNVFLCVFYEKDNLLHPLGTRRDAVAASAY